jgi:hypothetical protein
MRNSEFFGGQDLFWWLQADWAEKNSFVCWSLSDWNIGNSIQEPRILFSIGSTLV